MAYQTRVHLGTLYIQTGILAGRRLRRVLDDVHDTAFRIVATGDYTSGRLANSLFKHGPTRLGTRTYASVGSRLSYAEIVEKGAKIHPIFPRGAAQIYRFYPPASRRPPQLKFFWRKAGRTVYAPQIPMSPGTLGISHPGQKGKRYLTRALGSAAIKYRMRVIYYP